MKYIKTFESLNLTYSDIQKGIDNGESIYITDKVWLSSVLLDEEDRIALKKEDEMHKRIIPEVKVIKIDITSKVKLKIKGIFVKDKKEIFYDIPKSHLLRKANKKEVKKYLDLEKKIEIKRNIIKFNL